MARRSKSESSDVHTENLFCALQADEIAAYADQAAHEIEQADRLEAERVLRNKAEREAIESIELGARDKLRRVRERREERVVQCKTVKNFTMNAVQVIRLDTDEVVRERAMTPDERQAELPMIGGERVGRR